MFISSAYNDLQHLFEEPWTIPALAAISAFVLVTLCLLRLVPGHRLNRSRRKVANALESETWETFKDPGGHPAIDLLRNLRITDRAQRELWISAMNVVASNAEVFLDALGGQKNLIDRLTSKGLSSERAIQTIAKARQATQVRVIRNGFDLTYDSKKHNRQQKRIHNILTEILGLEMIVHDAIRSDFSGLSNAASQTEAASVQHPSDMFTTAPLNTARHTSLIASKQEQVPKVRRRAGSAPEPPREGISIPAPSSSAAFHVPQIELPPSRQRRLPTTPKTQQSDSSTGVPQQDKTTRQKRERHQISASHAIPQDAAGSQICASLESIRDYWREKLHLDRYPSQNEFNLVALLMEQKLGTRASNDQIRALIDYAANHHDQQIPLLFGHIENFIRDFTGQQEIHNEQIGVEQPTLRHEGALAALAQQVSSHVRAGQPITARNLDLQFVQELLNPLTGRGSSIDHAVEEYSVINVHSKKEREGVLQKGLKALDHVHNFRINLESSVSERERNFILSVCEELSNRLLKAMEALRDISLNHIEQTDQILGAPLAASLANVRTSGKDLQELVALLRDVSTLSLNPDGTLHVPHHTGILSGVELND